MSEQNIKKLFVIQDSQAKIENETLKDMYKKLDFLEILQKQNEESNNAEIEKRFVWIVNTFITILGEYKFFWEGRGVH